MAADTTINQPACEFNCNCEDCNGITPNPAQSIFGTGSTQAVSNAFLADNYYSKDQLNAVVLSGASIDLTKYYTKTQSDGMYEPIGNYQPAGNYQLAGNFVSATTLNNAACLIQSSGGIF